MLNNNNYQVIKTASNNYFQVLPEKLGAGGFGEVFLGYRLKRNGTQSTGQQVAVKYINKAKVSDWSVSPTGQKIPLEVHLMMNVNHHPNVIKLYDFIETKSYCVLFIEKPTNSIDLFDFISQQQVLNELMAKNFFNQILEAVIYCYQNGIMHRDIKDENFIIDLDSMTLKLIDFGAGCFFRAENLNEMYEVYDGTRVYAPPEWIKNHKYQLVPLTVWSLGILLFDMVQGNIPYETNIQIMNNNLKFKRHVISSECQNLIRNLLKTEAQDRLDLFQIKNSSWMRSQNYIMTRSRSRTLSSYVKESRNCLNVC